MQIFHAYFNYSFFIPNKQKHESWGKYPDNRYCDYTNEKGYFETCPHTFLCTF